MSERVATTFSIAISPVTILMSSSGKGAKGSYSATVSFWSVRASATRPWRGQNGPESAPVTTSRSSPSGSLLRDSPGLLSEFRAIALLVPPLTAAIVIVSRRRLWNGCQWLFWATVALGLAMSAVGLMGWATDELVFDHPAWLAWPSVFAL